jgi:hypothetical protein
MDIKDVSWMLKFAAKTIIYHALLTRIYLN